MNRKTFPRLEEKPIGDYRLCGPHLAAEKYKSLKEEFHAKTHNPPVLHSGGPFRYNEVRFNSIIKPPGDQL